MYYINNYETGVKREERSIINRKNEEEGIIKREGQWQGTIDCKERNNKEETVIRKEREEDREKGLID